MWLLIFIITLFIGLSLMTNITYVEDTTLSSEDMTEIEDIDDIENIENINEIEDEQILFDTNDVTIKIDNNYNIDVYVSTNSIDASVSTTDDRNTITLDSDMIDSEMSSTAMVGLCITGLDSTDSPTKISFEDENKMVADIDLSETNTSPIHQGESAESIVERCTNI